jgi:site-specific DNA recombinase
MKTIGYIRVSTDEQAREGISLDNQRAKIGAYCKLHGLELAGIIEDEGKSAKDLNREGMKAIIGLIQKRGFEAVVVYKLDRLSRKVLDTLTLIELMEKQGVAFHSISEKIDTRTAMGRFFLNIMASLAQMERDLISERTRDALRHKITQGQRAGQIPYGYRLGADGNNLTEHSHEQEAIQIMQSMKDRGASHRAICRELDRQGYKPNGKAWHHQTVANILTRRGEVDKKQCRC